MSITHLKKILGFATAALVVGCASNNVSEEAGNYYSLPDWVTMPAKQFPEGTLAATECVSDNANMSILKSKATALARADIAKQINIGVQAMDKTYQTLTENGNVNGTGSTFESVSKQVANKTLQGAIPQKIDYIPLDENRRQLCVLVVLSAEKNKTVFKSLLQGAGRQLTPDNEELMYQEYRAKKAQEDLERSINKG
jgi:hypothetical protein